MKEKLTKFLQTDISAAFRDTLRYSPESEERNTALDGLRGFAALLVIVEHSVAFGTYGIGRVGVYIFFILSAFLLSSQFIAKKAKAFEKKSIKSYFIKRLFRIYPLFALVVVIVSLLRFWYPLLIAKHLLLIQGDGIFWTIQQEVLFYFVLPLIMYFLYKLTEYRKLTGILATVCLIVVASVVVNPDVFGFQWAVPGTIDEIRIRRWHLDVFLFGVLAAMLATLYPNIKKFFTKKSMSLIADICGALFVLWLVVANRNTLGVIFQGQNKLLEFLGSSYPYGVNGSLVVSLVALLLMLVLLFNKKGLMFKIFSSFPLRFIGTISFSVYLVHDFIIEYFKATNLVPAGAELFVVATVLSVIVAIPIYAFVERPFMNAAKNLAS